MVYIFRKGNKGNFGKFYEVINITVVIFVLFFFNILESWIYFVLCL